MCRHLKILLAILMVPGCGLTARNGLFYRTDGNQGTGFCFLPQQVFSDYLRPEHVKHMEIVPINGTEADQPIRVIESRERVLRLINALDQTPFRWHENGFGAPPADYEVRFHLHNGYYTHLWVGHGWMMIIKPRCNHPYYLFDLQTFEEVRKLLELPSFCHPQFEPETYTYYEEPCYREAYDDDDGNVIGALFAGLLLGAAVALASDDDDCCHHRPAKRRRKRRTDHHDHHEEKSKAESKSKPKKTNLSRLPKGKGKG